MMWFCEKSWECEYRYGYGWMWWREDGATVCRCESFLGHTNTNNEPHTKILIFSNDRFDLKENDNNDTDNNYVNWRNMKRQLLSQSCSDRYEIAFLCIFMVIIWIPWINVKSDKWNIYFLLAHDRKRGPAYFSIMTKVRDFERLQ